VTTREVRLVAEGGPTIGRGHVARSLALAIALARRGASVGLELLVGEVTDGERVRAGAAGVRIVTPADQTRRRAADNAAGITIVDVPDPDRAVPGYPARRLVVFDDRDRFSGRARVVVQPSQPAWHGPGAADLILEGYRYAPVDAAFRDRRPSGGPAAYRPAPVGQAPRLIVCFGGSDPADVTNRLAGALAAVHSEVEVVVGAAYHGEYAGSGATLLRDPADLPDRLAAATVAVIGAGTMKFEVACLGLPAVLVAVADDQLVVGGPYAATGAARYLGDGRIIDPQVVAAELASLLADADRLAAMRRAALDVVDGRGAERLADVVVSLDA